MTTETNKSEAASQQDALGADVQVNNPTTEQSSSVAGEPAAKITDDGDNAALVTSANDGDPATAKDVPADWADDWREKMAGDDVDALKTLGRFNSPKDVYKAFSELRGKLSKGELKGTLPDNATEEQLSEYRKTNGIPDSPDGYTAPDGLQFNHFEEKGVQTFFERMHKVNADPKMVHQVLDAYKEVREMEAAALHDLDMERKNLLEDDLRAEWGNEYRANVNAYNNSLNLLFGQDLAQAIMTARNSEDGSIIGQNPEFVKAMASFAYQNGNVMRVMGGNTSTTLESIEGKISEYEGKMKSDWKGWHKDERSQSDYRSLLKQREKLKEML